MPLIVECSRSQDRVKQAWKPFIDLSAAQLHKAHGSNNSELNNAGFSQLREVIRKIGLAAECLEVAATQFGSRGGMRKVANDSKSQGLAQAFEQ